MLRHCVPNESQVGVHREQSQEGCGVGLGSIIHSGRPYLDDYGEMRSIKLLHFLPMRKPLTEN